jgi:hypothetical protein
VDVKAEEPATAQPKGTKKTSVILNVMLYAEVYSAVAVEFPSDATKEEIEALGTSVWKSLAPPETWSVEYDMDDIWMEDMELHFVDEPDDVTVDARLVRTVDGQLVALAN